MGKGKFHDIERPGQEEDINELFTDLYRRLVELEGLLTEKGDILVRTTAGYARLAAGTDGQVLTSRRSSDTGLAWEARASSGGGTSGGDRTYWLGGMAYGAL
jgi:hypothetical protein